MSSEVLRIFDEDMKCIGEKLRDEVHKYGDWHETFHCWFTVVEDDECYVLLQKRAEVKKDYPGLLDITSAGHLSADERVGDGVREVKEELGVSVKLDDLIKLGVMKVEIKQDYIWDREICHVYLYQCDPLPEFELQEEEVDRMYKGKLDELIALFEGKLQEIEVIETNNPAAKQLVGQRQFVGQGPYYEQVFKRIRKVLK